MVWYTHYVYLDGKLFQLDSEGTDYILKVEEDGSKNPIPLFLLSGIIIPFIFECISLKIAGPKAYFSEPSNYMDMIFIAMGATNCITQYFHSPHTFENKIVFILVLFMQMARTFKYLRIFRSFSPIVTMVTNVIWDLQQFMFFYFILCALLSLVYGVIGIQNISNVAYSNQFRDKYVYEEESIDSYNGYPGREYRQIGQFLGNFF